MTASSRAQHRRTPFIVRWLLIGVVLLGLAIAPLPGFTQSAETAGGNNLDGFPVVLDGNTLFTVRTGVPGLITAKERSQIITQRLLQVANDPSIQPDAFRIEPLGNELLVMANDVALFTIRDADAKALKQPREEVAEQALQIMKTGIAEYREQRSTRRVIEGIFYAVLSTVMLGGFWVVLQKLVTRLLVRVRAARQSNALALQFNDYRLLGSDAVSYLLSGLIRLTRLALILSALALYLPFLLSQFPVTRSLGRGLLSTIGNQFQIVIDAFVGYLPSAITLAIIVFITNYVIDFAKLVIGELGRDDAYSWFYPEWVNPTTRLVSLGIIAIAGVMGAPFLPGFGSPAFQGISIFLGALFTLGSSSAIANAVSGVILIYTRAFRAGDIVRIGDVTGKVIDKSLFVTCIARFPQEVVVIPNMTVLNGNVTNFSSVQRVAGGPLALHTKVTLGYDLPWRKVEEVLIKAAIATPGIVSTPSPFVLQAALNDFNVTYQLNAFTDCPEVMPVTYSHLHQNIQDYCNAAGIEIMSPNFFALRDGNHSTIPADYLSDDYKSPGFQVQAHNGDQPKP